MSTTTTTTAAARAAAVEREAGEARRAYLLQQIEQQQLDGVGETRRAREARALEIADARREARRTRETVAFLTESIEAARLDGDDDRAEYLFSRIDDAQEIAEAAAVALLAIDPRARMTAPDFLQLSANDPETALQAIQAAVWKAAERHARKKPETAAELFYAYGPDAEMEAYARALERAGDPERAGVPLALFIAREAGNALDRERYGATRAAHIRPAREVLEEKYGGQAPAAAVDTDFHAAGRIPGPERAALDLEKVDRALQIFRDANRETARAVAIGKARGYTLKEIAAARHISPAKATRVNKALQAAGEIIALEDRADSIFEKCVDLDRAARALIDTETFSRAAAVYDAIVDRRAAEAASASADAIREAEEREEAARAALKEAITARAPRSADKKAERSARVEAARAELDAAREARAAIHGIAWTPTLDPAARHAAALDRENARFTYAEKIAMAAAR